MEELKFKIGKKEYKLREITIQDYYTIMSEKALDDSTDSRMKIVSILSDCPVEELRTIKMDQWNLLYSLVTNTLTNITNHLDESGNKLSTVTLTFDLDGISYGFLHVDEMTLAEFADIDIIENDPLKEYKLHDIMAILYRPIKGKFKSTYTIDEYDASKSKLVAESFKQLPLHYILGALSFFLCINKVSIDRMLDSLMLKAKTQVELESINLIRNSFRLMSQEGGGIYSISSLETISSKLKTLTDLELNQYSAILHTEKINKGKKSWKLKSIGQRITDKFKRNK